MKMRGFVMAVLVATLFSCSEQTAPPRRAIAVRDALTFGQSDGGADLELGGDCSLRGSAACLSGLCVRVAPGLRGAAVCSIACGDAVACPAGWSCEQTMPGPKGKTCVPEAVDAGASVDGGGE